MTLPQTYVATLVLMILGALCWGSWANTFKLAGNWRFELYYLDFSLGVILTAAAAAFTFGTMGSDGFQFLDDLLQTGKRNIFFGGIGGVVFNLANMLLLAAISVAGLAVGFTVGLGTALVVGLLWSYFIKPQGDAVLLFVGAAIVAVAIVIAAAAYWSHAAAGLEIEARAGMLKTSSPRVSPKGIVLSLLSGLFMGSFLPLVDLSRTYGATLGPYALGFVFAAGVLLSTFVFSLFFMNLPVEGEPVEMRDYIRRGNLNLHLLGIAGGLVWCLGAVVNFVAAAVVEPQARVGAAATHSIGQGAAVLGTLWGLFVWKEFAGADFRVKSLLSIMLALFICGLGMISIALL